MANTLHTLQTPFVGAQSLPGLAMLLTNVGSTTVCHWGYDEELAPVAIREAKGDSTFDMIAAELIAMIREAA